MGKYIDRDGDEWVKGCVYCSEYNKSSSIDKCDAFHESKNDNGDFKKFFFDSNNDCPRFLPKS